MPALLDNNGVNLDTIPVIFNCGAQQLIGIIHQAENPTALGLLIIVGGPQYRAGSHRQFVSLCRYLADRNMPSMRFDVRGTGDSQGDPRNFELIGDDIGAAIDCFFTVNPQLKGVALWGLCDGAAAASLYAYQDARIKALILLNPWLSTATTKATTYFKHYYLQRLLSADFWLKLAAGKFDFSQSATAFVRTFSQAIGRTVVERNNSVPTTADDMPLPTRIRNSLLAFPNPVLFILSGQDFTAKEFKAITQADQTWRMILSTPRVSLYELPEADHTFSTAAWKNQVAEWTASWLKTLN